MTRYLAITTCNAEQWQQYGRCMATAFKRYWPDQVGFHIYGEGFVYPISNGVQFQELYEAAPWLVTWKSLYRDPKYNGGKDGRDYRHDAVRFAHKIAALSAAVETCDCDVLIWIDADTVTHEQVTVEWLDSLFPEPAVVAWLDRDDCYPECGFLMFRMPAARSVIRSIVKAYRNGSIFNLPEWHDSYVIQHMVQRSGVSVHSLSGPQGRKHRSHPWVVSRLAEKMDHFKGEKRKKQGRTMRTELPLPLRTEVYWR